MKTNDTPSSVDQDDPGRPFAELADSGLLWLINATVFWPRGYAFGIRVDGDGVAQGWVIDGDGTEVIETSGLASQRFKQAKETLEEANR